eukprot:SAG31_NODE_15948_length_730_cov_0.925515_1_plen_44_part_01
MGCSMLFVSGQSGIPAQPPCQYGKGLLATLVAAPAPAPAPAAPA